MTVTGRHRLRWNVVPCIIVAIRRCPKPAALFSGHGICDNRFPKRTVESGGCRKDCGE